MQCHAILIKTCQRIQDDSLIKTEKYDLKMP